MDFLTGFWTLLSALNWERRNSDIDCTVMDVLTTSLKVGGIQLAKLETEHAEARWERLLRRWSGKQYTIPGQCSDFCCCEQCFDSIG